MRKHIKSNDKVLFKEKPWVEKYAWWILGGILALTFFLYKSSLYGDFLDYDDIPNVVNNMQIQHMHVGNLSDFFATSNLYMYTPLTFISFAFDFKIGGLHPFYFKLSNLIFHLINILLVFIFSNKLLRKRNLSILISLLFALHPVNPDTVSWISTRSNLLSTLFFLLTLILYLLFLEKRKNLYIILSIFSFGLSLLSKSSTVMLPFVLLGLDYYQKRKINIKLLVEKAPYFILSIIMGIITIYFRTDSETTQSIVAYNLADRFFIICYSIIAYLSRILFPFHLSEIYGYPIKEGEFLPVLYYISPIIILIIGYTIYRIRNLKREIIFGLFFFIVTIIITQITLLEDGFKANRYAYLPFIGIYFIIAFIYDYFTARFQKAKKILISVFLIMFSVFSVLTYQRSLIWMNTISLFNHAIEQSPDAAFAYNSRGIAKYTRNDLGGAINDYNTAIKLNPGYSGAFYNRGIVYFTNKEYEKALYDYSKAIELNANFASAFCARGILQMDGLKNDSLAIIDYSMAIRINPTFAQAYYNRGLVELRMNNNLNACNDFQAVKKMGYSQANSLIEKYCR